MPGTSRKWESRLYYRVQNLELTTFPDPEALARSAATDWLSEIEASQQAGRLHCVALSGGRIALDFFTAAADQAKTRAVSFGNVHFFWADERCVYPDDEESNFRNARERLFDPLGIPASQVHRVRGEDQPETAAKEAEAEICRVALANQEGQPVLDLILLGMGEDGHVASLFPGEPQDVTSSKAVYRTIVGSPKPPPNRITLGYPAIAAARKVWVLISGAGKQSALRASLRPSAGTPLGHVLRIRDQTRIYTDIAT